jgi:hypothetical protein
VQAERMTQDVELGVVHHLIDSGRHAQKLLLQIRGVLIQRAVRLHRVALRITVGEIHAQLVIGNQFADFILKRLRISAEIFQREHDGSSTPSRAP